MTVKSKYLLAIGAFMPTLQASVAQAQDTLADPAGSGVLVSAVGWLQGTLLGTIATVVAVIAVASVGFMMLTGRINWRYGVTGCCQSNANPSPHDAVWTLSTLA